MDNDNSQLNNTYKQTEIGVIPSDWESGELRKYFSFISYGFTNPMPTVEDGIYMITANDVNNGRIKYESARKTSEFAYKNLLTDKSRPKLNDILLTKDGTLGRLAIVGDKIICINQSVAVIRPNDKVKPQFLKILLESEYYQKIMIDNAGGSTIKHIYITVVDKMKIALPPTLAEQTAIATALSDADSYITSLEKLIAKKRMIKQGAMQELLKPKEGWVVKKLGEIAIILTGTTPPTRELENYGEEYCFVSPADLGFAKYISNTEKKLSSKGFNVSRKFPKKSILFTCIGSTIGKTGITKYEMTSNQQINAVLPNDCFSSEFMYYYLNLISDQIKSSASEQAVPLINKTEFEKVLIFLPSIETQTRIAAILSDMESEIEQLEKQLTKAQSIKQGMMQQLLTGKVRLV